jgi:hypothetical protein
MSADTTPPSPAEPPHAGARAILDAAGVTLPEAEIARFAEAAAVIRGLAEAIPPSSSFADEPAVIFDAARAGRG